MRQDTQDKLTAMAVKYRNKPQGMLGTDGAWCDHAIHFDKVDMLNDCIGNDWMDRDTRTLDNKSMIEYCVLRGAGKCMARMIQLG